jgi:hypothetical protein
LFHGIIYKIRDAAIGLRRFHLEGTMHKRIEKYSCSD